MLSRFVASLLLVAFPLVHFGNRWTEGRERWLRGLFWALAAFVVVNEFPPHGGEWTDIRRAMLVVAASIVAWCVVRHVSAGTRPAPAASNVWLGLTAVAGLVVHLNFFQLHGPPTQYVHLHELAHYYLGSKYAAELGYDDLYAALLRAEVEDEGRLSVAEARDLASDRLVPAENVAAAGAAVERRFSADRWRAFRDDARDLRTRLGPNYAAVVKDHGYNPSPVWSLVGGGIANLTSASAATFRVLTLLDVAILAALAVAVAATLGWGALALAVVYVGIAFGVELGWVGGAYLRQMWFAGVVGFALCLARGRHATAGVFLAFATMLRVFPVFFAVGLAGRALGVLFAERRLEPRSVRFFAAFAATALALFLLTALHPGLEHWAAFFANTARHSSRAGFNSIGLVQSSAWLFGPPLSAAEPEWLEQMREWREALSGLPVLLVLVPATAFVFLASRRLDDLRAAALGAALLVVGLNLSSYYFTFLVLVVLAFRDRPEKLAWLFGAELAVHALHLFEPADRTLYLYKGLLLLYALIAIFLPERSREAAGEQGSVSGARA